MGYSIYVAAKSKEDQMRMFDFLEKHFHSMGKEMVDMTGLRLATDLSYCDDSVKWPVGFDYTSWVGRGERAYAYTIVYWMSQVLTDPPHHYYYDSEREVVPEERDEDALFYFHTKIFDDAETKPLVDSEHCKEVTEFIKRERERMKRAAKFVVKERERLKDLWLNKSGE